MDSFPVEKATAALVTAPPGAGCPLSTCHCAAFSTSPFFEEAGKLEIERNFVLSVPLTMKSSRSLEMENFCFSSTRGLYIPCPVSFGFF